MRQALAIQDIEEMRRQEGIDDAELRVGIRALRAGDFVKVTLLTGAESFETLKVRITSIRGSTFRGKLAKRPTSACLKKLAAAPVVFTTAHIHSLLRRREGDEE